jgi:hypothetical protein
LVECTPDKRMVSSSNLLWLMLKNKRINRKEKGN